MLLTSRPGITLPRSEINALGAKATSNPLSQRGGKSQAKTQEVGSI